MTTAIERAHKAKCRDRRREARERWLDRLSISVKMTCPRGVLGWICGLMLMLMPPVLVVATVWIGTRFRRGEDTDGAA